MFPVKLRFQLDAAISPEEVAPSLRSWFPDLRWGTPDDLMRDACDWPEIVADIQTNADHGSTEIDFLVYPRMVAGQDPVMVPIKIALMRAFAREFECGVVGDTAQFAIPDTGHRNEDFLCRAGRFFQRTHAIFPGEEHGAWQPVDDIPACVLDPRGRLIDEASTIAAYELWRCSHWEDWKPRSVEDLPPIEPGDFPFTSPPNCETADSSRAETDQYLQRLAEWEDGFGATSAKQLIGQGISLPAPDTLDDEALHQKLWEVIRGMAQANQFLYSTNHLSDRELYEYLWNRELNELNMDLTGLSNCGYHLDLVSSGSDEETFLSHKYYADPRERADWMASFPDSEMPAHEDPPYDRDRHLPKRGWP